MEQKYNCLEDKGPNNQGMWEAGEFMKKHSTFSRHRLYTYGSGHDNASRKTHLASIKKEK